MIERHALRSPVVARPDFIVFPPLHGVAGQTHTIRASSYKIFRARDIFATDTFTRPGHGTRIVAACVGNTLQFNTEHGVPTWLFSEYLTPPDREGAEKLVALIGTQYETEEVRQVAWRLRLANAVSRFPWDTCQPEVPISIQVVFKESCVFEAVLWGVSIS